MKKVAALFLLIGISFHFLLTPSVAQDLVDDSIDNAIKTQYNTKKIEEDLLPALPQNLPVWDDSVDAFSPGSSPSLPSSQPAFKPSSQSTIPAQIQNSAPSSVRPLSQRPQTVTNNSYIKNNVKTSTILNKGRKFKVKLQGSVSDRTPEGTRITFVSQYPETFRYITIPAGTVFKGKVADSHPPYLSGNGGLIVIQVNEIVYKGIAYEIDAKISIADGKRIFLNNIKGKRKYMKNMWNSTSFGSKYLKKSWKSTCKFAKKGAPQILITPFPLAAGVIVYGANVISSPVLALFSKGGSISIPSGTRFVIQLRDDAVILR